MNALQVFLLTLTIVLGVFFIILVIIQLRQVEFPSFSMRKFLTGLKNLFSFFIYDRKRDRIKEIFRKSASILHKKKGMNFYSQPLYLMIGKVKCMIPYIIKDGVQKLPFGLPYIKEGDPCSVWMSERGIYVAIEVNDEIDDDGYNELTETIKYVLKNLKKHRRRRKIDGLIIVYDCEELLAEKEDEEGEQAAESLEEAEELKLLNLCMKEVSYNISYKVPLYFTIANSDYILGLKTLAETIPKEGLSQILGWTHGGSDEITRIDLVVKHSLDEVRTKIESIKDFIFKSSDLTCEDQNAIFIKEYMSNLFLQFGAKLQDRYSPEIRGNERFFIRGVYLTLNQETSSEKQQTVFVRDLFTQLFFLDFPLAGKPVKGSTVVDLSKNIAIYLFITGLPLCLFFGDRMLQKRVNAVGQPLQKVATEIKDPSLYSDPVTRGWRELYSTAQGNDWALMNPLIPASWFSPLAIGLPKNMEIVAAVSFSNIFYNKIRADLDAIYRVEGEDQQNLNTSDAATFLEFSPLNIAIEDANRVLYYIQVHNNLSGATSYSEMNAVLNPPEPAKKPAPKTKGKAKKPPEPKKPKKDKKIETTYSKSTLDLLAKLRAEGKIKTFDLAKVKASLNTRLINLFSAYGDSLLKDWPITKNLTIIQRILSKTSSSQLSMDEIGELRLALDSFINLSNEAAGPGKVKTITEDKLFQFGIGNYLKALDKAKATELITPSQYDTLQKQYIGPFRDQVKYDFNYVLVLAGRAYPYRKYDNSNVVSPKLQAMLAATEFIDKYDFDVEVGQFDPDAIQIFNSGRYDLNIANLQSLELLLQKYTSFNTAKAKIKNPDEIFYINLLFKKTIDAVATRSALSTVNPLPEVNSDSELLAALSQNAAKAYTPVESIEKDLTSAGLNLTKGTLNSVVTKFALNILAMAREQILAMNLYMPVDKFDVKDPTKTLVAQLYGIDNMNELKAYLEQQYKEASTVGLQYAEYAFKLLQLMSKGNLQLNDADQALIQFWQNTADLSGAKTKKKKTATKDSPVAELDNFIMKTLNTVDIANCNILRENTSSSNDFYTITLNRLKASLYQTCEQQSVKISNTKYGKIAAAFNAYLLGNFPFVAKKNISTAPALPYDTLTQFYTTYEKEIMFLLKLYEKNNTNILDDQRYNFLVKLQNSLTFLLANTKTNISLPEYYVEFTYRINRANEVGADQILSWTFSDSNGTLGPLSKTKQILWQYGDSIALELMWASDSPEVPSTTASNGLTVQGKNATFSYTDPWSLLRLVLNHRTSMFPQNQKLGTSLAFTIPTQRNDTKGISSIIARPSFVRFYAAIKLLQGKTMKPLVLPDFPVNPPSELHKVNAISANPRVFVHGGKPMRHRVSRLPGGQHAKSHRRKAYSSHAQFSKNNPVNEPVPESTITSHEEQEYFPRRSKYQKLQQNELPPLQDTPKLQNQIPAAEQQKPKLLNQDAGKESKKSKAKSTPEAKPAPAANESKPAEQVSDDQALLNPERNLSMDLGTHRYTTVSKVDRQCYAYRSRCINAVIGSQEICDYCCQHASRMFLSTAGFKCSYNFTQ